MICLFTKDYLPFIIVILVLLFIIYSFIIVSSDKIKSKIKVLLIPIGLVVELIIGFLLTGVLELVSEGVLESNTVISTSVISSTTDNSTTSTNKFTLSTSKAIDSPTSITELGEKHTITERITKEDSTSSVPYTTEKEAETIAKPTVYLSFERINNVLTDNNADLRAFTSFKADKVTIISTVDGIPVGSFSMKSNDGQNWVMHANFYEENTYVITAIAEGTMGEVRSNPVTVEYPFK